MNGIICEFERVGMTSNRTIVIVSSMLHGNGEQ